MLMDGKCRAMPKERVEDKIEKKGLVHLERTDSA
jgi:hypothetical protein